MHSPHFSEAELACQCGCGLNNATSVLLAVLEDIRTSVGKPVVIHSACRCAAHNLKVGGAPRSQHVLGKAADIAVAGMSASELYAVAAALPQVHGIGVPDGKDWIHVDVRAGSPVRWRYDEHGREKSWSQG